MLSQRASELDATQQPPASQQLFFFTSSSSHRFAALQSQAGLKSARNLETGGKNVKQWHLFDVFLVSSKNVAEKSPSGFRFQPGIRSPPPPPGPPVLVGPGSRQHLFFPQMAGPFHPGPLKIIPVSGSLPFSWRCQAGLLVIGGNCFFQRYPHHHQGHRLVTDSFPPPKAPSYH